MSLGEEQWNDFRRLGKCLGLEIRWESDRLIFLREWSLTPLNPEPSVKAMGTKGFFFSLTTTLFSLLKNFFTLPAVFKFLLGTASAC